MQPIRKLSLSNRLLGTLSCLILFAGLDCRIDVIPGAEAGSIQSPSFPIEMVLVGNPASQVAVDCDLIRRKIGRVKAKRRLARRIVSTAQRRRSVGRLTRQLTKLRRQLARCLAAPPIVVPIPNAGPLDRQFGTVAYEYRIGKYEVTLSQYAGFLNAVAAEDTYGLYNSSVEITRSGSTPNFTYAVNGSGNRPVSYVSWFDAARFCNWLHNGMPSGPQDAGTTERGAYTLDGAITNEIITREAGANFWIPSENEWYKAAYHDPRDEANGGPPGDDQYWLFSTMSDDAPSAEAPPGGANSANFFGSGVGGVTDVGAYLGSASFYGTYDQGGNLPEWNDGIKGLNRGVRGGSWHLNPVALQSTIMSISLPDSESGQGIGFRIASP